MPWQQQKNINVRIAIFDYFIDSFGIIIITIINVVNFN